MNLALEPRLEPCQQPREMVALSVWLAAYQENAGRWICPVCARASCFDLCWNDTPCDIVKDPPDDR